MGSVEVSVLHRDKTPTQIPFRFCAKLLVSVPVSVSVCICLGVGQYERTIIWCVYTGTEQDRYRD